MKKEIILHNGYQPCHPPDLPGDGFITPDSTSTIEFAFIIAATVQIMDQHNRLRCKKVFREEKMINCFA